MLLIVFQIYFTNLYCCSFFTFYWQSALQLSTCPINCFFPILAPFSCKNCSKTYKRLDSLKRHIRVECEKAAGHECTRCGKCFKYFYVLQRHVGNRHRSWFTPTIKPPPIFEHPFTFLNCIYCFLIRLLKHSVTVWCGFRCKCPLPEMPETVQKRQDHDGPFVPGLRQGEDPQMQLLLVEIQAQTQPQNAHCEAPHWEAPRDGLAHNWLHRKNQSPQRRQVHLAIYFTFYSL